MNIITVRCGSGVVVDIVFAMISVEMEWAPKRYVRDV